VIIESTPSVIRGIVEEERQKAKDDNQAKNVSQKKNTRRNNNKNGEKK